MEINEENINKVAEILKSRDFDKALVKVQDYSRIAQQLIEKHPDLTPEQIGQVYEQEMEQNKTVEQEEKPKDEEMEMNND